MIGIRTVHIEISFVFYPRIWGRLVQLMKNSSYVFQRFVSAKEANDLTSRSKGNRKYEHGSMSGEEAKTFYESVLSSASSDAQRVVASKDYTTENNNSRHKGNGKLNYSTYASSIGHDSNTKKFCRRSRSGSRKSCLTSSSHPRLENEFLKHAQEGNLKQVKDLLSDSSVDINVCDQFSWTAVMCASHGGQVHIVKYLLEKGALWRCYNDLQGRTALDLAKIAGHLNIVKLLSSYSGRAKSKRDKPSNEECAAKRAKFWCSVCEQEFTDDKNIHEGSTVHLFNTQRKPQRTFYYIPEGNIGYQMMLKSGWNEDQGLGPDGIGRKYPIKTVLKRDRLGFGSKESQQARVTHFGPNDDSAVKRKKVNNKEEKKNRTCKKTSRREKLAKEKKEKNWERNMRMYMNSE